MAAALCGPCCLFPALGKEPQGRKYLRAFKEKSHVGSPLQLSGMALELKRRCSSELPLQAASSSDRERISWESPISTEGDYSANPMEKWFGRGGGDEHGDDIEDGDMLREECGVVGIFGDSEASRLCYLSLHALQHRGQEGAGIVACDEGSLNSVTGMGLVSEVFNQTTLGKLTGSSAVGHVRYATAGESALKNVQPFVAGYRFGSVGVAHNGNLVNYNELRAMLEEDGSIFNTSSDTEVVLHLIAMSKARPFIARLVDACQQLEGAYSIVFLTEDKLVAVRDPYGFRPLVMGRRSNGAVVFASETCALDLIEATYEREINPGEVVVVDDEGISSLCLMPQRQRKACVFEHIYFALPNSIVFGLSVYQSRYRIGEILALETPVECDVVIAVPDSGVVAALGYAAMAGVPFQQGLIRSHYVGRTFIEPSQKIRDFGVKLKLAPVKAVLNGKRVVVVDDSIVRGTTSSKIVRLIKEAGATEVHLRIASPPITGSCYYGVDTPSKEELISFRLSVEETRAYVGADSLAFLPLERLSGMLGADSPNFCYACFTGDYPVPPKTLSKDAVEKETAHKVLVEGLTDSWKGANSKNPPKLLQDQSKGSGVSDVQGDTSSVSWDSQPRQVDTSPTLVEPPQRIRSPTFYQTFAAGVPSQTVTPVQAVSAPPRQAFMPGSPRQLPLSASGPGATAAVQSPLFTSNPAIVAPLTPSPTVQKVDKMNVSGGFDHIQMG